jgi:hypothetical protein
MKKKISGGRREGEENMTRRSFAEWCGTYQPRRLGLEPEYVAQICKHMQRGPEMRAIRSGAGLIRYLKLHRSWLFWTEQLWARFELTAMSMWDAYKEDRPPNRASASENL